MATATARDPQDRFADAAEFLAALDDVAGELELPSFTVPIPQNSAATRAAAVPTDITDLVGPPTMVTEITEAPPVTETRVHEPIQPPIEPPAQAPVPARIPEEPVEQPAPMNNRSKVGLVVWLLVIALLTAAIAIGAWWFGSGRYGEIPQVLGMDRTAAVTTVEDAGFRAVTEIVYHDEVPADLIAGTEPADGEKVVRGNEVTVLVSQGRPTVPDPQGMDILSYQAAAAERTLSVTTGDPVWSADVAEGRVAETDPDVGEAVLIGSTVTVHLSRGPEPIQVPAIVGIPLAEAETRLAELDLTIARVEERFDADAPTGQVLAVSPEPGTTLTRGSEVSLVVNSGLTVPDVEGMSEADATAALNAAGFTVDNTRRDRSAVGTSPDTVVRTSPSAGEIVDPEDADVTLTLAGRVTVPDVVGMTAGQARDALDAVGLRANVRDDDAASVVTRQRPAAGDDARLDSTVRLTL